MRLYRLQARGNAGQVIEIRYTFVAPPLPSSGGPEIFPPGFSAYRERVFWLKGKRAGGPMQPDNALGVPQAAYPMAQKIFTSDVLTIVPPWIATSLLM